MPCKVPGKNSVFWKLACLLVVFCLLMIWLSWSWGRYMDKRTGFLSEQAHGTLVRYAGEAERAWETGQQTAVDQWLQAMGSREPGWVGVIGQDLQSLSSYPLNDRETERLTFLRGLDWPISHIKTARPWIKVPFPKDPAAGSLVIELPQRFMPGRSQVIWRIVTNGVIPGLLTLLLCVGLYRVLIVPLNHLREQANAWRADQLGARLSRQTTGRQDELGELARAFDQMSERLQSTVLQQQQLLRDLSHELRTPLSRLQLAWLDAERGPLPVEDIQVQALWEMLTENARFESGWPQSRLPCLVDGHCWVRGHLNSLAQALENILRNAIRHSPPDGVVSLSGHREGDEWHLWLDDQGGGVAPEELERIFAPFTRLDGSRPGDGGFGLGLSIARNALRLQGGSLWAENHGGGLRVHIRLPAK